MDRAIITLLPLKNPVSENSQDFLFYISLTHQTLSTTQ
jgi:hypothetical protein